MKINPINDHVLVRPANPETKTASGIVIPDSAQDKVTRGTVVGVGNGVLLYNGTERPLRVSVGDEVIYGKYAGTEIEVDGKKLLMIKEGDVLGTVD